MKLALNAVSAQMGGAVTYLRNVLPALSRAVMARDGGGIMLWARPGLVSESDVPGLVLRDPGSSVDASGLLGIARRVKFDQWDLARRLRAERVDALFSSANIGTLRCPVPQVLLVRNPIFFEPLLLKRLASPAVRAKYAAERQLILASVRAADAVLFPTQAMLDMVAVYAGGPRPSWHVAPYGARHDLFYPTSRVSESSEPKTLLHVSHYCDQKNLGTLLEATDLLDKQTPGRYRLRFTAAMSTRHSGPQLPSLEDDRRLYAKLEKKGVAVDLGSQAYSSLPELYRSADMFVFPSYTESFGHPLVEAMACGLPIVAADVAVNREMCGDAALYFSPFDATACANAVNRVASESGLAAGLRERGLRRAAQFTWERHVEILWNALGEIASW